MSFFDKWSAVIRGLPLNSPKNECTEDQITDALISEPVELVSVAGPKVTVRFRDWFTGFQPVTLMQVETNLRQRLGQPVELYLEETPDDSPLRRIRKNAVPVI